MSPRSAANSNWVPLGGRHEVACTQILAAAALCTAMDTRKTTTHMKAPLPGHLETSPSEAHARGCGPVGLAGYKRDPIGRAHSTINLGGGNSEPLERVPNLGSAPNGPVLCAQTTLVTLKMSPVLTLGDRWPERWR